MFNFCEKEEVVGRWKESIVMQLVNRDKFDRRTFQQISRAQYHTEFHPAFHWQISQQLLMQKLMNIISTDSEPVN
jgi:hypothetical protein